MKYYIATKLENHEEHNKLRDILQSYGHEITYDWTVHGPVYKDGIEKIKEICKLESKGVKDCDVLIVLSNDKELGIPTGKGTHVELGMALALDKLIFIVGKDSVIKGAVKETCCFYHDEKVVCVETFEELTNCLQLAYSIHYNNESTKIRKTHSWIDEL